MEPVVKEVRRRAIWWVLSSISLPAWAVILVAGFILLPIVVLVGSPIFGSGSAAAMDEIPPNYRILYQNAVQAECPALRWEELAAVGKIESGHGANMGPSSQGALGPMQFEPSTWTTAGVDGNGDGVADIMDPEDAIPAAAKHLCESGVNPQVQIAEYHCLHPEDDDHMRRLRNALWAYNNSCDYVQSVLDVAARYEAPPPATGVGLIGGPNGIATDSSPGVLVPIPGFPGEMVDNRILPDLMYLVSMYDLRVSDCYSADSVHETGGEHPLGVGCDLVPREDTDAGWDKVDQLAAWAEPAQNSPREPFRWVGYNGDENHGRGNHLHLSWEHAPAAPFTRPAWVKVFSVSVSGSESQVYHLEVAPGSYDPASGVNNYEYVWAKFQSSTTEGNDDREIIWSPGHKYAGHKLWVLWSWKPVAGENPGRVLNFHTDPHQGGWEPDNSHGVSSLALDWGAGQPGHDEEPGLVVTLENQGPGKKHYTILPDSAVIDAMRNNRWIDITMEIDLGTGSAGGVRIWVNGRSTPVVNARVGTIWPSQTGFYLWEGIYTSSLRNEAEAGDYLPARVGTTFQEAVNDTNISLVGIQGSLYKSNNKDAYTGAQTGTRSLSDFQLPVSLG